MKRFVDSFEAEELLVERSAAIDVGDVDRDVVECHAVIRDYSAEAMRGEKKTSGEGGLHV